MTPEVQVLEVLLHGEVIGTLTNVGGDRTLFSFSEDYVRKKNRPALGLHFKDSFGELITNFNVTQTKLPPFFSNLLPEDHLQRYLAQRAGVNPVREFYLLWALGKDLPGAVTVRAIGSELPPQEDFTQERSQDGDEILRFSLAGVQMKFSAVNEASGGLTIPATGTGGSWIVKLPSSRFPQVPENEFSMMTLAKKAGIEVPDMALIDIEKIGNLPAGMDRLGRTAFAIKRFDRSDDGSLVHMEDFAQVFGVYPEKKYEKASARSIAKVIAAECGEEDIVEFIRRLTFNTLIGNADMHLKNWSLIYRDKRHATLAPAYDFISTIAYIPDENAALKFSRSKRFDAYSQDELSHLAAKAMLPETSVLRAAEETVELFLHAWQEEKRNLPLSCKDIETIERHMEKIPLAKGL